MKHIVLIDDDMFIRDLVATKLGSAGHTVAAVATGDEGFKAISDHKPDLILLDLDLPGVHGLEILKQLKAGIETASIPVIIFSNNDSIEMRQETLAAGAADFFVKVMIDMSELEEQLQQYLR